MMVAAFLPVLLILLLLFVFLPKKRRFSNRVQIDRKWTYVFFAAYLAILLIAAVTVGFLDSREPLELPMANENAEYELDEMVWSGNVDALPADRIIRDQTYPVQDRFRIVNQVTEFEESPQIILERKDTDDGVIEEKIIRAFLIVGPYDLSGRVEHFLPRWEDGQMIIYPQPKARMELNSYEDAELLQQFTGKSRRGGMDLGSSTSRGQLIYLRVPKGLVVDIDDGLYASWLDEEESM